MSHFKALTIKAFFSLALLYLFLGLLFRMSFGNILFITLVLGVVSYVLGDLFILPKTNNLVAALVDFGLAFLIISMMSSALTTGYNILTMSFVASFGVAIFEFIFHKRVANQVVNEQRKDTEARNLQYRTEASDELVPKVQKSKARMKYSSKER